MTIKTDPEYWDCECQDGTYIKPKTVRYCPRCNATPDEQPDSRVDELVDQGYIKEQPTQSH